jgi:hypothetical protein
MLLLTMLVMPQVMLLQVTRSVTVAVDSVRPIITLIGELFNVTAGGTFTDPGYRRR